MKEVYYTDGSASPNPGPGGYAVIHHGQPVALGSEEGQTTNIRMEGLALLAALRLAGSKPCIVYTDSEFWVRVLTEWAAGWHQRGWTKKGGPIRNLDLVQPLYEAYQQSAAQLTWVRGHEGNHGNELADHWANRAREGVRLVDGVVTEDIAE